MSDAMNIYLMILKDILKDVKSQKQYQIYPSSNFKFKFIEAYKRKEIQLQTMSLKIGKCWYEVLISIDIGNHIQYEIFQYFRIDLEDILQNDPYYLEPEIIKIIIIILSVSLSQKGDLLVCGNKYRKQLKVQQLYGMQKYLSQLVKWELRL